FQFLKKSRIFSSSKAKASEKKEEDSGARSSPARTPAGSDYSTRSTRSNLGSVRQQCDIFSITNDPATEFEDAPAPVPPSVRTTWRVLSALSLIHTVLLLVNIVLLFSVDNRDRQSHQQVLLFSLLMLSNIVLVIVMALVVIRQNKAITQSAICCTFWTAFAYFVILAYNSLDDPLSLVAGRTCLAVIIVTILELIGLSVYFVLRFIRYKKVVELYNCRACTCDKDCVASREPSRLDFYDLWPRAEPSNPPQLRTASSVDVPPGSPYRESPASEQYNQPSGQYM
ncbi:hypothetical protein PMAYCL1PPCAC_07922, partial [Pristionchus mayeri]